MSNFSMKKRAYFEEKALKKARRARIEWI